MSERNRRPDEASRLSIAVDIIWLLLFWAGLLAAILGFKLLTAAYRVISTYLGV